MMQWIHLADNTLFGEEGEVEASLEFLIFWQ